jgi:hypothetical protein
MITFKRTASTPRPKKSLAWIACPYLNSHREGYRKHIWSNHTHDYLAPQYYNTPIESPGEKVGQFV